MGVKVVRLKFDNVDLPEVNGPTDRRKPNLTVESLAQYIKCHADWFHNITDNTILKQIKGLWLPA